MTDLTIQTIKLTDIRAYKNNPKLHVRAQVAKIRESIREFGFINPVLLNENLEIIAGHGRVAVACNMGTHDVLAIILSHFKTRRYTSVQLYSPYYCRRKPYSYILGSISAASSRMATDSADSKLLNSASLDLLFILPLSLRPLKNSLISYNDAFGLASRAW